MECEICGKQTSEVRQIDLEGTTLIVCSECSSYGKEIEVSEEPVFRAAPAPARKIRPPRGGNFDAGFEIVPDYGTRIRNARQARQITARELALKIFEKESLLHRIENQAIKPSDKIIEKIEGELGVKLREKKGEQ